MELEVWEARSIFRQGLVDGWYGSLRVGSNACSVCNGSGRSVGEHGAVSIESNRSICCSGIIGFNDDSECVGIIGNRVGDLGSSSRGSGLTASDVSKLGICCGSSVPVLVSVFSMFFKSAGIKFYSDIGEPGFSISMALSVLVYCLAFSLKILSISLFSSFLSQSFSINITPSDALAESKRRNFTSFSSAIDMDLLD